VDRPTSVPELKAPKTPGLVAVAMYTVKEVGMPLGFIELGCSLKKGR
jgi:hypothetical protein